MGNSWSFFTASFSNLISEPRNQHKNDTYGKEIWATTLFIKSAEKAKLDPQSGFLFVVVVMKLSGLSMRNQITEEFSKL